MEGLLLCLYVLIVTWAIARFRSINYRSIQFHDGILVGMGFFLIAPITLTLIYGDIASVEMRAGPYEPVSDWQTSLNLALGAAVVLLFHTSASHLAKGGYKKREDGGVGLILVLLILYIGCAVFTFFYSGRAGGGHWQGNLEASLRSSPLLIIIGNFANVYRGAIFGVLYNLWASGKFSKFTVVSFGFFICLVDIMITFNRITIAYFAIVILLMFRSNFVKILLVSLPLLPFVSYFSSLWTAIRGLALMDGYSISGFINAFETARSVSSYGDGSSTNAIFDSENIIVFDWLVKHTGDYFPVLYGSTFIVRPLTVFIPSTLWPNKPGVFGVDVGTSLQGVPGLALNSTLFGEAYGNFLYFWPLALLSMLYLLSWIFGTLGRRWSFVNGASFFIGFALWRFDMSSAFIGLVALFAFQFVFRLSCAPIQALLAVRIAKGGPRMRRMNFNGR
ncbi:hypothetical protein [Neorhizobium petrolearium]|uniref:hypothetical protein n=1 Tax=Neorhizobium petrolearium TaxID=515361 RepID=UPI003F188D4F